MKRLLWVVVPVLGSGCTYVEQRWNDLTDAGTVSVSLGAEVGMKWGQTLHVGLGSTVCTPTAPILFPIPGTYQIAYGNTVTITEHWPPVSTLLALEHGTPMGLHTVNYGGIYPYGPIPDKEARAINPELSRLTESPPEHRCFLLGPALFNRDAIPTHPKDFFDVELGLALVLGGKISFCPVEFVDFVLGFIPGIDILNDDHHMDRVAKGHYWYKSEPPHEEYRNAPPEMHTPPAPLPPGTAR